MRGRQRMPTMQAPVASAAAVISATEEGRAGAGGREGSSCISLVFSSHSRSMGQHWRCPTLDAIQLPHAWAVHSQRDSCWDALPLAEISSGASV